MHTRPQLLLNTDSLQLEVGFDNQSHSIQVCFLLPLSFTLLCTTCMSRVRLLVSCLVCAYLPHLPSLLTVIFRQLSFAVAVNDALTELQPIGKPSDALVRASCP